MGLVETSDLVHPLHGLKISFRLNRISVPREGAICRTAPLKMAAHAL